MNRKWESWDLSKYMTYSSADYSSDGKNIIFLENKISHETGEKSSDICILSTKDKIKTILKSGEDYILHSRIKYKSGTKDSTLFYLSNESGFNQLYSMDLQNNSIEQVTNFTLGIKEYLYSSKYNRIVVVAQVSKDSDKEKECELTRSNNIEKVYVIDELNYKSDELGYHINQYKDAILSIDLDTGKITKIDDVAKAYGINNSMSLPPCENYLLYEKLKAENTQQSFDSNVYIWNFETEDSKKILDWKRGTQSEAVFSRDMKYIAFVGNPIGYHTSKQLNLYIYDVENREILNKNIYDAQLEMNNKMNSYFNYEQDFQVADYMVCDSKMNVSKTSLSWDINSTSVLALVSIDGGVKLLRFWLNGEVDVVHDGFEHVSEFSISNDGSKALLSISSSKVVSKLVELDLDSLDTTDLIEFKIDRKMATYKKVKYTGSDGGLLEGILALPENIDFDKKYSMIVNIHGGPYTMHGNTFHHEIQIMTSNDYIVLLPNPRGSFGYGQKHIDGVVGKYAQGDYLDIMELVEKLVNDYKYIDSNSLFVTGGSYGGFMTNWIITKTDLFKAAVTQRSICNYISMWGTSDIGYHFYSEDIGQDILEPMKLWSHSPLAFVENVKTPTLIIHSMKDYRCPVSQAQEWFTALKYLGVETKMILFEDSNHSLSRSGNYFSRVRRLDEIMLWFDKY